MCRRGVDVKMASSWTACGKIHRARLIFWNDFFFYPIGRYSHNEPNLSGLIQNFEFINIEKLVIFEQIMIVVTISTSLLISLSFD